MKQIKYENSLAAKRPELAAEWHPTKNGDLTPDKVAAYSNNKAWWLQKHYDEFTGKWFNFEWDAVINNRGRSNPFVTGKRVYPGFNDLATRKPELAAEWDYKRNYPLTPQDVTAGSRKKVWWCINYYDEKLKQYIEMSWPELIANRALLGYGCPYLSGQKVLAGWNDLATKFPELAKQWHPTKNGDLKPTDFTTGTTKKVWWIEEYYSEKHGRTFIFEWPAAISKRTSGEGNPFVPGNSVFRGLNDLESNYPELAKEWDWERNGNLTPDKVTYSNNKKVWWKIFHPHPITGEMVELVWPACIHHRTLRGDGCPYLSGKAILEGFNDLATTHPQLAAQWDYDNNGDVTPTQLTRGSDYFAHWKLLHYDPNTNQTICFRWQAQVSSRKDDGSDCPYLSNMKVWKGFNDLQTVNPDLAAEWHPTKNKNLLPSDVVAGSSKAVWWKANILGEWYEWKYPIYLRNNGLLGIPELQIKSKLEILIAKILTEHNIDFEKEKVFDGFKSEAKQNYPYDFFLFDNLLIEADGRQHFEERDLFGGHGRFERQIKNDNIKTRYAHNNNLPILRIPYIYDNKPAQVESFVLYFIKTHKVPQEILDFYSKFAFSEYVKSVKEFEQT